MSLTKIITVSFKGRLTGPVAGYLHRILAHQYVKKEMAKLDEIKPESGRPWVLPLQHTA